MKGMKGRFLKKLTFLPTISSTLKQSITFQLNFSEKLSILPELEVEKLGVSEHVKELKNEGSELEFKDTIPVFSELDVDYASADEVEMENEDECSSSLLDFEEKCPPGGNESIVLYSTSLRGIRKTFEDCNAIRFLLESFRVMFHERDVSMHMEFREELWKILENRVIPPRLFIKGRYIGGADEVLTLHEQGKLHKLLEGLPPDLSDCQCTGCANVRFVVCLNCHGSRKIVAENNEMCIRCSDCNENGLVKCPICC